MDKTELVAAVRRYAEDHYEVGGWDVIVEAYTDAELADLIGRARTADGAIRKVRVSVGIYADKRADIEATAF